VYAPCAGPILAAVISASATQGASADLVVLALAYGAGSAAVLLLIAFGGRRAVERIRRAGHGPTVQRTLGGLLVATAVFVAVDLDVRFQGVLANELPAAFSNPTSALERTGAVESRLAELRGSSRFDSARAATPRAELPVLGAAPDFTGNDSWLNTPGGRPLSLRQLRGKIVLVDFWTYTCINCLRTLPALRAWHERYADDGLTIVGIHTPEFAFERERENVEKAVRDNELRYPVAQDNQYATWQAWGNQYWPAKYLIDARGRVRYTHFGEGAYGQTEEAIRALLAEAGPERDLGAETGASPASADPRVQTPETYLGSARAEGFVGRPPANGSRRYPEPDGELPPSHFALSGHWQVNDESATAVGHASIHARPVSREVYLVLSAADGRPQRVEVLLDGRPIPRAAAGADVRNGAVMVRGQRLYRLVSLPELGEQELELRLPPGVSAYAFTFG
jgi:thiol-disulfide isomerase/thioredoxin